jgi:hypothetical protein
MKSVMKRNGVIGLIATIVLLLMTWPVFSHQDVTANGDSQSRAGNTASVSSPVEKQNIKIQQVNTNSIKAPIGVEKLGVFVKPNKKAYKNKSEEKNYNLLKN